MGCIKDNNKNAKKKMATDDVTGVCAPIGEDEVGRLNKMTDLEQEKVNTITDKSPI
ncbi:MAG: hypothetical protein U1D96_04380 [Eubacteriales bacterium]|nr:hypothetical protein [Bacillota bacterium]MBV1726701.1 hypothetical protein [Desulforudis sp.]MDP3051798.1 hypothetical protein [Eubacteriales bacterium]MDQ7788845.1 hypothetical protein [Clostridia bacterium]MBU4533024.1 hypothetical protein [Bacillota bacterium]